MVTWWLAAGDWVTRNHWLRFLFNRLLFPTGSRGTQFRLSKQRTHGSGTNVYAHAPVLDGKHAFPFPTPLSGALLVFVLALSEIDDCCDGESQHKKEIIITAIVPDRFSLLHSISTNRTKESL